MTDTTTNTSSANLTKRFLRLGRALGTHQSHKRQYRELLHMDDAMLRDMGVTRDEVRRLSRERFRNFARTVL